MIEVKYTTDQFAVDPIKTYDEDAGWDVVAIDRKIEKRGGLLVLTYNIGLRFEIPTGYFMDVRSRSSIINTGMWLSNGVGTIDSTYRGPISMVFYKLGNFTDGTEYNVGDRIGQIVFPQVKIDDVKLVKVDELSETIRGDRGYGSTGVKMKEDI